MGKLLTGLAAGASLLLTTSAAFADGYSAYGRPSYAPFSWTGFYMGANVGGAWGTDHGTVNDSNPVDTTHSFSLNPSGVFGGGQLGYNLQSGNIVFGIEADLGDLDLRASAANSNIVNAIPFRTSTSGGLYGDVTGRLGYSFGSTLLYSKGGFAFFDGDAKVHAVNSAFFIPESSTWSVYRLDGWWWS
jgi:outer membrane immunogenic protein